MLNGHSARSREPWHEGDFALLLHPCQIQFQPPWEQHSPIQAGFSPAETTCPRRKHGGFVSDVRMCPSLKAGCAAGIAPSNLEEVWIEALGIARSSF